MTWHLALMTKPAAKAFSRIVKGAPPLPEMQRLSSGEQDAVLRALEAYWARRSTTAKEMADKLERQLEAVQKALLTAHVGWHDLLALRVVLRKEEY